MTVPAAGGVVGIVNRSGGEADPVDFDMPEAKHQWSSWAIRFVITRVLTSIRPPLIDAPFVAGPGCAVMIDLPNGDVPAGTRSQLGDQARAVGSVE